ncbi:MAG TPA: ABC transporter substrate-binding protein [Rectinemataceae bacterium]|nr:ABC transporter substrate-binding protein [Rectinemataceae bacterium]
MKKIVVTLAVLALVTAGVFGQNIIKIGANWPLADQGSIEASKAAQLAVDEINKAGGVAGKQLKLIVVDDEGNGQKGVAALERLVTVDKVDVLFGGYSSGVAAAQIPTLKKYGLVTVSTGAASSVVEKALGPSPESDFYFHLHPWDYNQGLSYAQGWRDIQAKYPNVKIRKIFLAYEEGPFGKGSWMGIKAQYGDGYEYDGASFKSALMGGSDYSGVLQAAKDFNPDLFIWAGYAPDALPLQEQAKAMNFNPPIFLGAPPAWPADIGSSPLTENVMSYGMWASGLNDKNAQSKKFYEAYQKAYGVAPTSYFAPLSYSGIYILAEAIKKAGGTDKAKLIAALEQTKYASPLGETITFSPSNVIKHQGIRDQKILQWQNGKQQIIWPFQYSTTTPVFPMPAWK